MKMTGPEFAAWRSRLSLTQAQAAQELMMHLRTYQRYEAGSLPVPPLVALACKWLEVRERMKEWVAA